MASSQDINYVPFTRQRMARPPLSSADTMFAGTEGPEPARKPPHKSPSGSVSDPTGKRRVPVPPVPPVPPPSSPIPIQNDDKSGSTRTNNPTLERGRSAYRPNTLSKATLPLVPPPVPPYIAQDDRVRRRSRSAPPLPAGQAIARAIVKAQAEAEAEAALAKATRVQGLRSMSGGPGSEGAPAPLGAAAATMLGAVMIEGPVGEIEHEENEGEGEGEDEGVAPGSDAFGTAFAYRPEVEAPSPKANLHATVKTFPSAAVGRSSMKTMFTTPVIPPPPTYDDSDFVLVENSSGASATRGAADRGGVGGTDSDTVEIMKVPLKVPVSGVTFAIGKKPRKSRFGTPPSRAAPPAFTQTDTELHGAWSGDDDEIEENNAAVDGSMARRTRNAESMLSTKDKKQILKEEAKNAKTLSKIIKKEGKTERKSISLAMSELEDLQRIHKLSVKDESKALTSHNKTLSTYTKALSTFEEVKRKYQGLESRVQLASTQLEQADFTLVEHKERTRDAMERVKEKREEVESLRKQYGIEERERLAQMGGLNGEAAAATAAAAVLESGEGMARQKTMRGRSRFGGIILG